MPLASAGTSAGKCMQDAVVSDAWEMLTDLMRIDRKISKDHPENQIPAQILGAITPEDCHYDPTCVLKELEDGWRPVLVQPAAPSIMHVPWLAHLDALVNACGIHVTFLPSRRATLSKVRFGCILFRGPSHIILPDRAQFSMYSHRSALPIRRLLGRQLCLIPRGR